MQLQLANSMPLISHSTDTAMRTPFLLVDKDYFAHVPRAEPKRGDGVGFRHKCTRQLGWECGNLFGSIASGYSQRFQMEHEFRAPLPSPVAAWPRQFVALCQRMDPGRLAHPVDDSYRIAGVQRC